MGLGYSKEELFTNCVSIKETEISSEEVKRRDEEKDMEKRDDEQREFIRQLEAEGHTCIRILETYSIQVDWCKHRELCLGHDFRKKESERKQRETKQLILKLRKDGHTCIEEYGISSYVTSFTWCESQEMCIVTRNLIEKLRNQGKSVVSLCAGEPDFNTPEGIKKATIEALNDNQTHYSSNRGYLGFR